MQIGTAFRRLRRWRGWLALGLAALVGGCAGSQGDSSASSSSFNWRQFQGTKLRILLGQSPWHQAILGYLPEFEELTGIRLETEIHPQETVWGLLENDLKTPGRVDVFSNVPALDGIHFLRRSLIQPVNDYLINPKLTASDYRWDDFLPKLRAAMQIDGAILGPPVMAEHLALIYRKDLFKQHQIAVPRTLDELEAAARLLHQKPMGFKGAPGVGIVSRGQGPVATGMYSGLLHAMGGTWLDARGQLTIDGPQSLAALEWIRRVIGQYAPPDVSRFGWHEASALFLDGRAAMYIEGSSIYPLIEESSSSRVREQVGYALFPAGPGGPGTTVAVRGLAIAKHSLNPGSRLALPAMGQQPGDRPQGAHERHPGRPGIDLAGSARAQRGPTGPRPVVPGSRSYRDHGVGPTRGRGNLGARGRGSGDQRRGEGRGHPRRHEGGGATIERNPGTNRSRLHPGPVASPAGTHHARERCGLATRRLLQHRQEAPPRASCRF